LVQALLFGLLGGAVVAVSLALLLEQLADLVRAPHDVAAIAPLPLLGRIGHVRTWGWWRRRKGGQPSRALVMQERRSLSVAEGFRSLRAALQLTEVPRSLHTVVICSGGSHE